MLGIIRVLTVQDKTVSAEHGYIIEKVFGLSTKTFMIEDQPLGIYDDTTHMQAVPKIVAAAKAAEAAGARAVLISCAADPAIEECRQVLSIPVIGAGSAAAAMGLAVGKRVGVLNLTGPTPAAVKKVLGVHFVMEAAPQDVGNTTHLLTPSGLSQAQAAAAALSKTADVIVMACTGYSTIGLAPILRSRLKIPVVDAVEAGGVVAFYHLGGMTDARETKS